jgi:hypothetical protein
MLTRGCYCNNRNHHATISAWRTYAPSDAEGASEAELQQLQQLQLLKPGDTRFASAFIMLERVLRVKLKLQQLMVSDTWAAAIGTLRAVDKVRTLWQPFT